jgi:tetratricopeptide (TPR) repeat protein
MRLSDPGQVTALIGAGASVESGLPTAYSFSDVLIDSLVHRRWAAAELKALTRMPRPGALDENDAIRFELLLLWIADVFDRELRFLDLLDEFTTPGPLHCRLAAAAQQGLRLVTANFDDLLERALLEAGATPATVDAHRQVRVPAGSVPVMKLHGTRRVHRHRRNRRSTRPLQATTDTIAATSPGNLLNPFAAERLHAAIAERTLVVCGYSGSDDLDIVPALASARPAQVVWIDHGPGAIEVQVPRRPGPGRSPWEKLVWHWRQTGVRVRILRGRTGEAFDLLGIPQVARLVPRAARPDWRRRVRAWAREVRDQDPTGLGLAALLFGELGRYDHVERAIRESRPSLLPSGGWSAARRAYERAQTALLRPETDPKTAYSLGLAALEAAASDPAADDTQVLCHLLLGRAAFFQQRWELARSHFEAAEATTSGASERRAFILGWIGRTEAWRGNPTAAKRPLRQSIRLFRQAGELEGLLDSLHALGFAEASLGNVARAVPLFTEADDIARILGFIDRRFTTMQALADCHFMMGNLERARNEVRAALKLVEHVGNDEMADGWALLADIELELGQISAAERAALRAIDAATVITRRQIAAAWALVAEARLLQGRAGPAHAAAERALTQPEEHVTWWGRARAEAVLAAHSSDGKMLTATPSGPSARTLTGAPLLAAASCYRRLGLDTPEIRRLRERARRYARRIGASHWER